MSDTQQQPAAEGQGGASSERTVTEETVRIDVSSSGQPGQEPQARSRIMSTMNKYKENLLERPIRYDILSIIFAVLIFAGGLTGYLKSDSVISLVSGVAFAFFIAVGTYFEGARRNPYPLLATLLALAGVMLYRYVQSFNFMPAGLIGLITLIMLLRHCYLLYLKKKQPPVASTESA